jgi:hypothetical protein
MAELGRGQAASTARWYSASSRSQTSPSELLEREHGFHGLADGGEQGAHAEVEQQGFVGEDEDLVEGHSGVGDEGGDST